MSYKKMMLSIWAVFAGLSLIQAQNATNQFELLKQYGEGAEFKQFYGVRKGDDGYEAAAKPGNAEKLVFEQNAIGQFYAFKLVDVETEKFMPNGGFGWLVPNHHTQPSAFWARNNESLALLFVDGLLYRLKGVEDINNITSFTIDDIYIPKAKEKKKMSLKEKMKAAKEALAHSGLPREIWAIDHEKVIKDYLVKMKPIQKQATANFTAKEKEEVQALIDAEKARQKDIKDTNEKFWASEEGQWHKRQWSKKKITLVNDMGSGKGIVHGQGVSTWLEAGESMQFDCGEMIHQGFKQGSSSQFKSGAIMRLGNECGATVLLSTLWKS